MKLKREEVADYLALAFNDSKIEEIIENAKSKSDLSLKIIQLSKFLITYMLSTGNLSEDSRERIISDYIKHSEEITNENVGYGKLDSETRYFKNYIFPLIEEEYKREHNIDGNISLKDYVTIYEEMVKKSAINLFYTHSFSGALYDEIAIYGLGIEREFFKKYTSFLVQYDFYSSYQVGKLFLTNLSYQSMGYALNSPEKIGMSFVNMSNLEEKEDESKYEYHQRIIENFKNESYEDEENILFVVNALNKINDFYYTNDESCIAIIDREDINPNDVYVPSLFSFVLDDKFEFRELLEQDETFKKIYDKAKELLGRNDSQGIEMLETLLEYLKKQYPNREETKKMEQKVEYNLFSNIVSYGLNCFHRANGEGYEVDSGKIPVDKLSIVKFKNPLARYVDYHKRRKEDNNKNIL